MTREYECVAGFGVVAKGKKTGFDNEYEDPKFIRGVKVF